MSHLFRACMQGEDFYHPSPKTKENGPMFSLVTQPCARASMHAWFTGDISTVGRIQFSPGPS